MQKRGGMDELDNCRRVYVLAAAVAECPRRAGDPAVLVADNSRARTVLGWQPARSSIKEIVQDAVSWHRQTEPVSAT